MRQIHYPSQYRYFEFSYFLIYHSLLIFHWSISHRLLRMDPQRDKRSLTCTFTSFLEQMATLKSRITFFDESLIRWVWWIILINLNCRSIFLSINLNLFYSNDEIYYHLDRHDATRPHRTSRFVVPDDKDRMWALSSALLSWSWYYQTSLPRRTICWGRWDSAVHR